MGRRPSALTTWIVVSRIEVLNIAGDRESTKPGIGAKVERFLVVALGRMVDGSSLVISPLDQEILKISSRLKKN